MPTNLWAQFEAFSLGERRRNPNTVATYRSRLIHLQQSIGKPFLADISQPLETADFRKYLRDHPDTPAETLRGVLSAAKAWRRWGAIEGYWALDGFCELSVPSEPTDPAPPLTLEQARTLLAICNTPREHRLIYPGLFAGTRISGSTRMDESCWKPDRLRWFEKGRWREVPLHPKLARVQHVILAEQNLRPQALQHIARKMRWRAGFYFTSHMLRRTFATFLLEADQPLWLVENLMGHAPSSMTLRAYAATPFGRKVSAIAKLPY